MFFMNIYLFLWLLAVMLCYNPGAQVMALALNSTLNSSNTTTTGSPSTSSSADHNNIATFGGVVGGSAGVLAIVSFSLFASIYVRRIRSARRERAARLAIQQEQDSAAQSDGGSFRTYSDGGSMREREVRTGAAFVPRFFPGTTPATPPAYASLPPAPPTFEESQATAVAVIPVLGASLSILDSEVGYPPGDSATAVAEPAPVPALFVPPFPERTGGRRMSLTDTHTLAPPLLPPPIANTEPTARSVSVSHSLPSVLPPAVVAPFSNHPETPFGVAHVDDVLVADDRRREEIRIIQHPRTPSPSPIDSLMHLNYDGHGES